MLLEAPCYERQTVSHSIAYLRQQGEYVDVVEETEKVRGPYMSTCTVPCTFPTMASVLGNHVQLKGGTFVPSPFYSQWNAAAVHCTSCASN